MSERVGAKATWDAEAFAGAAFRPVATERAVLFASLRRRSTAKLQAMIDLGGTIVNLMNAGSNAGTSPKLGKFLKYIEKSEKEARLCVRLYLADRAGVLASGTPMTVQDALVAIGLEDPCGEC